MSCNSLRKKVLAEMGAKPVEEAIADHRAIIQRADSTIADAAALTAAQEQQVKEMQAEFDKSRAEVEAAMSQEQTTARMFRSLKEKEAAAMGKADEARKVLLEAQKNVARHTVMAANYLKIKELEEAKRLAMAATEAAKADLAAQRQRQKEAWEATRQALQEAKAAKSAGKGTKRPEPEPTPPPPPKASPARTSLAKASPAKAKASPAKVASAKASPAAKMGSAKSRRASGARASEDVE